jgi:hypothetical protein
LAAEGAEPLEFLDGAAVETLGLGLVAEKQRPGVGLGAQNVKAFGQPEVVILRAGDFEAFGEFRVPENEGSAGELQRPIEAVGEEAAFEGGYAEKGVLGQGDALDGEEFLGVDGPVEGDEVVPEVGDGVGIFDADDGEVAGCEAVLAGVLGGAGFAFRGARAGGTGGIGLIGGDALGGRGLGGAGHGLGSPFAFSTSTSNRRELGLSEARCWKERR